MTATTTATTCAAALLSLAAMAGVPAPADTIAPDGFEVRLLCSLSRGSMAHFTLPPVTASNAVAHHTIEEVWYVISGNGRMLRRFDGTEETVTVGPGSSVSIPTGTYFQFHCDSDGPLTAVAVAMPPWPGSVRKFDRA